jgi:iron complex transport system substrate-binding protein
MVVTGCSSSSADSEQTDVRTVASAYGDIEVPVSPERVVAASYDTPWQLMSLGVKPAAVQDYGKWISEFTPEQQAFVDGLPTIGPFGEMNFEAIAAADPDIIVGDADEVDQAAFDRLSGIAPTVIVKGESRGDWKKITTELAEAIGKTDVLESTRTAYEENLERVRGEYADVIATNKWIHISLGDAPGAFSVQQPTGAIGNLVVNELGLAYGPGVPTNYTDAGYASYPMEQLADILNGVTVVLYPERGRVDQCGGSGGPRRQPLHEAAGGAGRARLRIAVERHRLRDRERLAERSENEGVCNALTLAHLFTACPQLTS